MFKALIRLLIIRKSNFPFKAQIFYCEKIRVFQASFCWNILAWNNRIKLNSMVWEFNLGLIGTIGDDCILLSEVKFLD